MLTDKYPCVTPLLWGECFRRNLEIIYECTETKTDQPGRWPAEESFLAAGLFTTDTAGSASPRCFHFYHPHLTGLKTTMQPFFFFFLSVEASGRISLSHGYSFMYERSEQHFHSLVLLGSSSRSANLRNSLRSKIPSEILLAVYPPASFSPRNRRRQQN